MRKLGYLGLLCVFALWGGTQAEKNANLMKLPEPVKQMVTSGQKGDGLAMVEANRACEVWGAKAPFEPTEVQKTLLPLAQVGHPKAMFSLGISMIRYAIPGPGDTVERGKDWVRRAAESGHAPAMLHMVSQLPPNAREEKNRWIKLAYETLLLKAEAGDADAMLELIHVPNLIGNGKTPGVVLISNAEEWAWLRKAMAHGSTEATIQLSEWLRRGVVGSREATLANRQESMELSMKLVEMGHWPTMADLGAIYAYGCWPDSHWKPTDLGPDGQKLRENPAKAWDWWDKAIAIAGKDAVLKYLLEHQNIGDATQHDCLQLPPRPKTR